MLLLHPIMDGMPIRKSPRAPDPTVAFRRRGRRIAGGLALAFVCLSAWVHADEDNPADVAAARKLGIEGVKLANSGKCSDAIDPLARAEKLHHAPTILGRLGECQVAVGKIVEGTENLQRVVREKLPAAAPAPFVAAKARAQKILDAAVPKIAHLTITVKAPKGIEVSVKVDAEVVSDALIGASRPTDPGDHSIEASAPGFLTARRTLTLSEGQSSDVVLTLEPDSNARAATPQSSTQHAPPAAESTSSTRQTLAYISLGVGGAGVVVGTIFGIMAMSKRNDLEKSCAGKVCPLALQSDIDSARFSGTISTVGFVVGGLGIAAGATLLLWPQAVQVKTGQTTVQPFVGLAAAGIQGTF